MRQFGCEHKQAHDNIRLSGPSKEYIAKYLGSRARLKTANNEWKRIESIKQALINSSPRLFEGSI